MSGWRESKPPATATNATSGRVAAIVLTSGRPTTRCCQPPRARRPNRRHHRRRQRTRRRTRESTDGAVADQLHAERTQRGFSAA
jgi:hypothetical protein